MPEELQELKPLSDDQAAKAFDAVMNPAPAKAKAEAPEPKDTKAAPEGDDNPDDNSDEEPEGPEPEEPEEEDDEEPEADDGDSEVTVRIDGRNQKIKLRELQDGYLRRTDYQAKTRQLAEERKAFQGELDSTKSEREQYRGMLGQLREHMQALMPQEPDWNALLQQHGSDVYLKTRVQWDQAMKNRQAVEAEFARVSEQQARDEQAKAEETLREEHARMLEAIPEWQDSGKMTKERSQMVDWARKQGFSDDDLNQVTDHRAVRMLRLAWIGDRMMKAKAAIRPAPEPEEVRPVKPLSTAIRQTATGIEAAKKRLAESGSDDDAAAVFEIAEKNYRRRRA